MASASIARLVLLVLGCTIACGRARPATLPPASRTAPSVPADLDHVIVAVDSFERGVAMLRAATGVTARVLPRHPTDEPRRLVGTGTGETQSALAGEDDAFRSALLDLGAGRYLELVGPDPSHPASARFVERFARFPVLTPIAWAIRTRDVDRLRAALIAGGVRPREIGTGERLLPGGSALRWRFYTPWAMVNTLHPSFIEWTRSSAHPSASAARGCKLVAFTLAAPEADSMQARLGRAGIQAAVALSRRQEIAVTLDCPTGRVQLPAAAR